MPNSINSVSPSLRDFLLNRNIVSDTISNNGLESLLNGVGFPTNVGLPPESVSASPDIEVEGEFHKDLNIINNKFQVEDNDYQQIGIEYIPGESSLSSVLTNSDEYQTTNLSKNTYKSSNTDNQPVSLLTNTTGAPIMQMDSYLDENGNLNIGGPSTQPLDVIGSLLSGGGVGFDPNGGGLVPDFDVRSSLAGRVLNAGGLINDTKLGQLGVGYLATAIGNNIAFNVQEETIGNINTNPLSLAMGGDLIVPNYKITVAKSTLGKGVDLLEKMVGFKRPVSILDESASIYTFSTKTNVGVANIERANNMIINTGKGQVLALFGNINSNLNPNLIGKRGGYAPAFEDTRISKGANTADGINPSIYAFGDNSGKVIDFLNIEATNNTDSNSPMAQSTYKLDGLINNSGFDERTDDIYVFGNDGGVVKQHSWIDERDNKVEDSPANQNKTFTNPKTLLYKTQSLFKTNRMRTLVSGKAVNAQESSEIQSNVQLGFMSKGSGVLSQVAFENGGDLSADNVFCRTWTTFDRYSQVQDMQKHSDLNSVPRIKSDDYSGFSVLDDNGFAKIGPYKGDNIKKFMFSIENLAWADSGSLAKLLPCEIGDGDLLTGKKGRIMWFPPYDISFSESTSVNWDKNNFIGRGEPLYTYNNTERIGNLSWKIVIDHPNYLNFMNDTLDNFQKDEKINSMIAGCLDIPEFRERLLSEDEKNSLEVSENVKVKTTTDDEDVKAVDFDIYFPNDDFALPVLYENGLKNLSETPNEKIDYEITPGGLINNPFNSEAPPISGFGLFTTYGTGTVGGDGTPYTDLTNFGLNGQSQTIDIAGEVINGGWQDPLFTEKIKSYLSNKCKYCRFKIVGYASQQGGSSKNDTLSLNRANSVKTWLTGESGIISSDDLFGERRVKVELSGEGETGTGCTGKGGQDREECKRVRKVSIKLEYDPKLKKEIEPEVIAKDVNEPDKTLNIPVSRFYTECNYFEKLEQTDRVVFNGISDKIKYFHPGFHSITPEGFNSRLNFLQQCTRQGPTTNDKDQPENLAFGRPPVCILRLGDFYHTKIIIDNLSFDYEPLVWDLNPEGVGVQPMIVTVNMSFAFIGGSSLNSPINKLQNAISFNYFANTEVYDPRAEKVKVNGKPGELSGELIAGSFPDKTDKINEADKDKSLTEGELIVSQEVLAEFEALQDIEDIESIDNVEDDVDVIDGLKLVSYFKDEDDDVITLGFEYKHKSNSTYTLNGEFSANIIVNDFMTNTNNLLLGKVIANPNGEGSFIITGENASGIASDDEIIISESTNGLILIDIFLFEEENEIINEIINLPYGTLKVDWITGLSNNINLAKEVGI